MFQFTELLLFGRFCYVTTLWRKIILPLFLSSLRAKPTLNQVYIESIDIRYYRKRQKLKVSVSKKPSIEFFDNIEYRTSTTEV